MSDAPLTDDDLDLCGLCGGLSYDLCVDHEALEDTTWD